MPHIQGSLTSRWIHTTQYTISREKERKRKESEIERGKVRNQSSPCHHIQGYLTSRWIHTLKGEQEAGDVLAVRDHTVLDKLMQLVVPK